MLKDHRIHANTVSPGLTETVGRADPQLRGNDRTIIP